MSQADADTVVAFPGAGRRGDFFAVDRRAWARACVLGLNAAVAYLVLARGSGPDQRTTAWSVHAVETHTGIGRPRAQKAIAALTAAGLVRATRAGARPRYHIAPAHEAPGCEGFPPPALDPVEQRLYDRLAAGQAWVPNKTGREWDYHNPRALAAALVSKGRAREVGQNHYTALPYDAEAAARPDWAWLPNALVDGARGDLAAPVELVRQTQSAAALRLLVDLYHAQSLASDGGIHWRGIRQGFTRQEVGRRGSFVVYGFAPGTVSVFGNKPFVRAHMTGETEPAAGGDQPRDRGWSVFWAAWDQLVALGLVGFVAHLVEADTEEAEVVHPYALGDSGEAAERRLARAAHAAAQALLPPARRKWAEGQGLWLALVPAHRTEVQMVGVARLRYRPRTAATAAWFARMGEWDEWATGFEALARRASEGAPATMQDQGPATMQDQGSHQGRSREVNESTGVSAELCSAAPRGAWRAWVLLSGQPWPGLSSRRCRGGSGGPPRPPGRATHGRQHPGGAAFKGARARSHAPRRRTLALAKAWAADAPRLGLAPLWTAPGIDAHRAVQGVERIRPNQHRSRCS